MVIAALRLTALVPEAGSLKAKRKALRALKDRVKSRFNVAIAEVGAQDLWQRTEVGVVAVGPDEAHLNSKMDKLLNYIDSTGLVETVSRRLEFIHTGEDWTGGDWD